MKKNFLFLSFAVPNDEMEKEFQHDNDPQVQTHKFIWNLINGLESIDSAQFVYVSTRPIRDYPNNPRLLVKGGKWLIDVARKKLQIREIPFINTSVLRLITRFFSVLFFSIKEFHQKKNKAGIVVYSVHLPFMVAGYLLSRLYDIDFVTIWTDPPSIGVESDSFIKKRLRRLERCFSSFFMGKADKVIALTSYLAEDFAPGKPALVIEGIADGSNIEKLGDLPVNKESSSVVFVYTGQLKKVYGISNIVEGFLALGEKNAYLEIYGRGDYENELRRICELSKNISYKGFLPNEKVLKAQREADFLINARSAEDDYVKYSFPSKTLEYMLSGTPVITTMLPGMPRQYKDYMLVLDDNKPETIASMMASCVRLEPKKRVSIGRKALEFAKTKDCESQAKKIIDFLNQ